MSRDDVVSRFSYVAAQMLRLFNRPNFTSHMLAGRLGPTDQPAMLPTALSRE